MNIREKQEKIINRRFILISTIKGAVFGSLIWKLFDLQIIENKKYNKLSEKNQFSYRLVLPERGQILDRKNRVLAANMDAFSLILNWKNGLDINTLINKISNILKINDDELKELINKIIEAKKSNLKSKSIFITKNLSQKDVSKLSVNMYELPEIMFAMTKKRVYPQGGITCHITGYTGTLNNDEIKKLKIPSLPGLDIGKTGLEKFYDFQLRGNFGRKRDEVSAKGHIIDSNLYENPISGENLKTSIDLNIQSYALDRLERGNSKILITKSKAYKQKIKSARLNQQSINEFIYINKKKEIVPPETGSIVVMDVENGEVICSVSSPHFNPNIFSRGLNIKEWNNIKNNKKSPLLNRSLAGLYPPGSTIKMAVALAALENDIISQKSKFFCSGVKEYGNMKFHCWAKHGHGNLNLSQAIERSCDVFFYELGLKVGIDKIADMLRRLGLGSNLNLESNELRKGLIPTKNWKLKKEGISWTPGETINASIGQGYMLVNPMQLATMTARLANSEFAIEPTFIHKKKNKFEKLNINPKHLKLIRSAMVKVVNSDLGTAKNSMINSNKIKMAGKTGTVQVVRISEHDREKGITKNIDREWRKRDHALFVGYAPINKPKYAISVVVEHGGSGSGIAAPIARDIFSKIFKLS